MIQGIWLAAALALVPQLVSAQQSAAATSCPAPDWSSLKIAGGTISRGGQILGQIEKEAPGYVFEPASGVAGFSAKVEDGPGKGYTATVLDCAGNALGEIEEIQATDNPDIGLTVKDGAGQAIAWSGPLGDWDRSFGLGVPGGAALARIKSTSNLLQRYELEIVPGFDARLALVAVVMKYDAEFRHAVERNNPAPRMPEDLRTRFNVRNGGQF